MITTVLSIALCGALFGLAAWLKPKPGCGGDCGACSRPCSTLDRGHDHV